MKPDLRYTPHVRTKIISPQFLVPPRGYLPVGSVWDFAQAQASPCRLPPLALKNQSEIY